MNQLIDEEITMRDCAAIKVMASILSSAEGMGSLPESERKMAWRKLAKISYEIADALVEVRDQ